MYILDSVTDRYDKEFLFEGMTMVSVLRSVGPLIADQSQAQILTSSFVSPKVL